MVDITGKVYCKYIACCRGCCW